MTREDTGLPVVQFDLVAELQEELDYGGHLLHR
jgi:hypothetical protein